MTVYSRSEIINAYNWYAGRESAVKPKRRVPRDVIWNLVKDSPAYAHLRGKFHGQGGYADAGVFGGVTSFPFGIGAPSGDLRPDVGMVATSGDSRQHLRNQGTVTVDVPVGTSGYDEPGWSLRGGIPGGVNRGDRLDDYMPGGQFYDADNHTSFVPDNKQMVSSGIQSGIRRLGQGGRSRLYSRIGLSGIAGRKRKYKRKYLRGNFRGQGSYSLSKEKPYLGDYYPRRSDKIRSEYGFKNRPRGYYDGFPAKSWSSNPLQKLSDASDAWDRKHSYGTHLKKNPVSSAVGLLSLAGKFGKYWSRDTSKDKGYFSGQGMYRARSSLRGRRRPAGHSVRRRAPLKRRRVVRKKSYSRRTSVRRPGRYRGTGAYFSKRTKARMRTVAGTALRALGAGAGAGLGFALDDYSGVLSGANYGYTASDYLSKYLGLGDYGPVQTNSLIKGCTTSSSQMPVYVNATHDGDLIFSFREFIQNITVVASGTGTSLFNVQSFPINAGLPGTFPFMSQLACNFTMYKFHGLMFQYVPTSGEFGSTNSNALGKVVMATQYDPDAPNFVSSQQMENYQGSASCKPSCGQIHGVETKRSMRATDELYVRNGTVSKDKVFTDIGNFQIATEGIYFGAAGTYVVGELWVTYKVRLSRAQLCQQLGNSILQDQLTFATASTAAYNGSLVLKGTNSIGCTASSITANTIYQGSTKYATLLALTPFGSRSIGGVTDTFALNFPAGLPAQFCCRVDLAIYGGTGCVTQYVQYAALVASCTITGTQNAGGLAYPGLSVSSPSNANTYSPTQNFQNSTGDNQDQVGIIGGIGAGTGAVASNGLYCTHSVYIQMNNPLQNSFQLIYDLSGNLGTTTIGIWVTQADPVSLISTK